MGLPRKPIPLSSWRTEPAFGKKQGEPVHLVVLTIIAEGRETTVHMSGADAILIAAGLNKAAMAKVTEA